MAFSDPVTTLPSGTDLIDLLHWGKHWSDGDLNGSTSLAVYIAGTAGRETFDYGGKPRNAVTVAQEATAFREAMALISKICNIDFSEVSSQKDADIIVGVVGDRVLDGSLGETVTPGDDKGPPHDMQGAVIVNRDAYSSTDYSSLKVGGYDFISFIHELGHAVGLKHPHDDGGGVFPAFPGVHKPFDQLGKFDLNQGINTMMSYNDGWQTGPGGDQHSKDMPGHGWDTIMALDIAALQNLYGANMTTAAGDDCYVLPSANAAGSYYSGIWDAGGIDTIKAGGAVNCTIDLRAATLTLSKHGGGYVSYHDGIFGGFTIAHNVVIENATGGRGDDRLTGNDANNTIIGKGGADVIAGGQGADVLTGGGGADHFVYTTVATSRAGAGDVISDFTHRDVIDLSKLDADGINGGNDAFRFIGAAGFTHQAGELRFEQNAGSNTTTIAADRDGDAIADFTITLMGLVSVTEHDFVL